jgi:hypothetical protein
VFTLENHQEAAGAKPQRRNPPRSSCISGESKKRAEISIPYCAGERF